MADDRRISKMKWLTCSIFLVSSTLAQPWSGILPTARATDWTTAGLPGGTVPSGAWTQSGSTIAAYGSSGTPGVPTTINTALSSCGTNHYVLLGSGDFWLNGAINVPSNCVLRGGGANVTRIHQPTGGGSFSCNGVGGVVCLVGSNSFGLCSTQAWPCPIGGWSFTQEGHANWTAGYTTGATSITLDNVTGITVNLTPIVLDQCDVGYAAGTGDVNCLSVAGVITSATVYPAVTTNSGTWPLGKGSGYVVNDTGTINPYYYYGAGATYRVDTVDGGGGVTAFTVTNGGAGYEPGNTGFLGGPNGTTKTSGSGTGFTVNITGVTAYDNNGLFPCGIQSICAVLQDSGTARKARSQTETVVATAISGSGPYTVTLSRPLVRTNWASGQGPQAFWPNSTITNAGVENIGFDGSLYGAPPVVIMTANKVWVSGIASNVANFLHVQANLATNFLVRDSYFYQTYFHSTTSYGIGSSGAISAALFENNIVQGVVDPFVANGNCTGCVFDYNFAVNQDDTATTVMFASNPFHSGSTDYILTEGNIGAAVNLDNTHGPHFLNTFFRNYFVGYELNGNGGNTTLPTNSTVPINDGAFSRYNNFVANVLGTPGYHNIYQCIPTSTSQQICTPYGSFVGYTQIWGLGFSDDSSQLDFSNNPPVPNDPLTATSSMRWGNWDSVRAAVSWCGNSGDTGWSTTCGSASEIPTADPNFPATVPTKGDTGSALPASFIYSSKPSWWPSAKAWPTIGPDVTAGNIGQCTGGTYSFSKATSSGQCTGGTFLSTASTNGSHAVSNPAMDCYLTTMSGTPDGTGAFLSFNANTCYPTAGLGGSSSLGASKMLGAGVMH